MAERIHHMDTGHVYIRVAIQHPKPPWIGWVLLHFAGGLISPGRMASGLLAPLLKDVEADEKETMATLVGALEQAGALDDPRVLAKMTAAELISDVFGEASFEGAVPEKLARRVEAFIKNAVVVAARAERQRAVVDGRLADHLAYLDDLEMKKKKAKQEGVEKKLEDDAWHPRLPSLRTFRRAKDGVTILESEEKAMGEWLPRFVALLEKAEAPVLKDVDQAEFRDKALRGLLGGARVSTVKKRVRAAEKLSRWLELSRGRSWPSGAADIIDYMHSASAEEPRVSFPRDVGAMLHWMDARTGAEDAAKLSLNPLFLKNLTQATADVQIGKDIKKAVRFPLTLISMMEMAVMDEALPVAARLVLWARLIKVYGGLRSDDLRRLAPADVAWAPEGLSGILRRTKTTGPAKKVRTLPLFIPAAATLSGEPWLERGFDFFRDVGDADRDHFFPRPSADLEGFRKGAATPMDMAALGVKVLTMVKDGKGNLCVEPALAMCFTGHSERSTLTSILISSGAAKSDRDLVGRWSPEGSDDYVRSYRAAIKRIIGVVIGESKKATIFEVLDETNALADVEKAMVAKGVPAEVARLQMEKLEEVAQKTFPGQENNPEEQNESFNHKEEIKSGDRACLPVPEEEDRGEAAAAGVKYLIAVAAKKRGACLHLLEGCWRARGRHFSSWEILDGTPRPEEFSRFCRDCWPKDGPVFEEGSTSEASASSSTA